MYVCSSYEVASFGDRCRTGRSPPFARLYSCLHKHNTHTQTHQHALVYIHKVEKQITPQTKRYVCTDRGHYEVICIRTHIHVCMCLLYTYIWTRLYRLTSNCHATLYNVSFSFQRTNNTCIITMYYNMLLLLEIIVKFGSCKKFKYR